MKKPRRGSAGLAIGGSGLLATIATIMLGSGDGTQDVASGHWLALAGALAVAIGPFLIEKVTDYLRDRLNIDLSDTGNALTAALADGRISRDEVKNILGEGVDDIGDFFDDHTASSDGPAPEDIADEQAA